MSDSNSTPSMDFDQLWDFKKPAETEARFRELLPAIKKENTDSYLQLLTQVARTEGLQGKYEPAHHTLAEVKASLGPMTPVAEVRYLLERGRVFNSSKKKDEARTFFFEAYELALKRKLDNLAVDAAHMLGIAESTPEKQLDWNLKAMAIAESSKDLKARDWLGSLSNNMGWTYHDSGKFEEALGMFKKALAFRETKGVVPPIRIAKWTIARTLRSLKRFEEALALQSGLEQDYQKTNEADGYVFEELGELYLLTANSPLSKKYFSLAHQELSKDEWFRNNEGPRLQRILELSK